MQVHDWPPHMHTERIVPPLIGIMDVKALIEADRGLRHQQRKRRLVCHRSRSSADTFSAPQYYSHYSPWARRYS